MTIIKPAPCPFCGTEFDEPPFRAPHDAHVFVGSNDVGRTVVQCGECGALGPEADEPERDFGAREYASAIAKWNAAARRS